MQKLREIWWGARDELKLLALWFIAGVPGRVGDGLRVISMRRYLQQLGRNTVFQSGVRITKPEMVSIGSNCHFAPNVFITGGGGVRIGDWVGFGPDVKVWSVNHRFEDPDQPWLLQGWDRKPVVIEDDVWLGANVFVMPGVAIGKGAIVSAGTVINRSVPPYAIVMGNPGRVVGWRKKPASASGESAADAIAPAAASAAGLSSATP